MAKEQEIIFFDFDGTLTKRDSLPIFLSLMTGKISFVFYFATALLKASLLKIFGLCPDFKTSVKTSILKWCLKGKSTKDIKQALPHLHKKLKWKSDILDILKTYYQNKAHIVIITGALDVYISYILKAHNIPHDHLFCTHLEINKDIFTGNIEGNNCVREEKAVQIKNYLKKFTSPYKTMAFGDSHSDRFMFQTVDSYRKV